MMAFLLISIIAAMLAPSWLRGVDALAPFMASQAARWSTVGIFVGSLAIVVLLMLLSWRHQKREYEATDFIDQRLDEAQLDPPKFSASAASLSDSHLLGDDDARVRARQATSSGRVVALLFNDARFFRYQPVHLAVRAEEATLRRLSRSISAVQVFAIRAGILGTFVGLIGSLARVQTVFMLRGTESAAQGQVAVGDDLAAIRQEIGILVGDVVQGLALAFGTSIAGILAAMIIAFAAACVRWNESRLLERIEKVGQKSQLFFRQAFRGNEELIRTAEELRGAIKENLGEIREVRSHLHLHSERLSATAGEIGAGLVDPVRLLADQSSEIRAMLEHNREATRQVGQVAERMKSIEMMSGERLEKLSDHMDMVMRSQADALLSAVDETRTVTAEGLKAVSANLLSGLSSTGRDLATGLGPKVEAGLRDGVSRALADLSRQTEEALRDGIRQVQAEGRRSHRTGFLLYAAALATLTAAGILSLHFTGVEAASEMGQAARDPGDVAAPNGEQPDGR